MLCRRTEDVLKDKPIEIHGNLIFLKRERKAQFFLVYTRLKVPILFLVLRPSAHRTGLNQEKSIIPVLRRNWTNRLCLALLTSIPREPLLLFLLILPGSDRCLLTLGFRPLSLYAASCVPPFTGRLSLFSRPLSF